MVECLCCKKRNANITITGNASFHICGETECRSEEGLTLGEWLLTGCDDKEGNYGQYYLIEDLKAFTVQIGHKKYTIPNDKRIVKGLANKIREITLKQIGN